MANIAIISDAEEGHLFPTFELARKLSKRGHRICYLCVSAAETIIYQQGFQCKTIFGRAVDARSRLETLGNDGLSLFPLGPLVRGEILDNVLADRSFGLLLLPSIFCLEGLVLKYRYKVPVVLLRQDAFLGTRAQLVERFVLSNLLSSSDGPIELLQMIAGAGASIKRLVDIIPLVMEIPELIFCPPEFALLSEDPLDKGVFLVGPGLDLDRAETQFSWDWFEPNNRLLFCSLGSQANLKREISCKFFQHLLNAIAKRGDLQLILSTGRSVDPRQFTALTRNIHVTDWAPQMQILRRADLLITHGGAGSVKEGIITETPMIVFPMMRDQFDSAERIVQHGLGLRGDIEKISEQDLMRLIETVLTDPEFKRRVVAMRECFCRTSLDTALKVIEQQLTNDDSPSHFPVGGH